MISTRDEREVLESPKVQGANEARAYSFDFSASGVTTISGTPTVALYDWSVDPPLDVSATLLSGANAPASGLVATMSGKVQSLTAGKEYRLYCRVAHDGGQTTELFCRIFGRL
jgi:hypothetical protein